MLERTKGANGRETMKYLTPPRAAGFHTSAAEMYDLVTDTWEKRASVLRGLGNTGFATVGGKIYMFGGSADRVLNTTYEYDTVADKWTQKANIPAPRMLVSAGVLDGKIYLIGGDTVPGGGPTASVLVYDPATDSWTEGPEMETARGSLAAAVVNGKIYAIGGHTGITWGLCIPPLRRMIRMVVLRKLLLSRRRTKKIDLGGD